MKKLNKKINELKNELKAIKKEYPQYDSFCEIEYQLDKNEVVVLLSHPYENTKDSDFEVQPVCEIEVNEVYDFVKGIDNDCKHIIISDTTYGDYKHNETLENTLKEYSEYFTIYGIGRDWEVKEEKNENETI